MFPHFRSVGMLLTSSLQSLDLAQIEAIVAEIEREKEAGMLLGLLP